MAATVAPDTTQANRGYVHPEVLVTTEWVAGHLNDPKVRIVESDEDILLYDLGHIPGAVRLDWHTDLQNPVERDFVDKDGFEALMRGAGISNDTTVVFYGDRNNWYACYTFWLFKLYGHADCRVMDGGRAKWEAEGREYSRDIPTYPETNYTAKEADLAIRAFRDDVMAQVKSGAPALVDVRSPQEYTGEVWSIPCRPVLTSPPIRASRRASHGPLLHPSVGGYGADLQLYALASGLDPRRYSLLSCSRKAASSRPAADVAGRFEVSRTLDELQACYERVLGARERRVTAGAHPGRRTRTGGNAAARRGAAWMLPAEVVPVSTPAAMELRFARIQRWLAGIGYTPEAFARGKPSLPTGAKRMPRGRGTARAFAAALQRVVLTPWWGLRALRERPAVVFTNTALNAPAIALIKRLLRDRVVAFVDVAGIRSLEIEQTTRRPVARALYRPIWSRLERLSVSSADLVLAVNEAHARLIAERYGHVNVQVLRDAAEPDLAKLPLRDREELGLPRDAVAVCFVGALICSRLEPLFDAWGEIAHDGDGAGTGPALCLVVIGDGPDLRKHKRRASAAGWLGSSVFFLGALPRDAAMSAARACDIAYSDCWSEAGFPFKLYEYMALAMPILVDGKAQMSEVLSDGRDALFFESQRDLTAQIRRLAGDGRLRERLGSAARATLLGGHTLPQRRREFEAVVTGTVQCVE